MNICSIKSEPAKNIARNADGKPVTRGMSAFFRICLNKTIFSGNPFARAVRTYCFWVSSRMAFLVSMVRVANPPSMKQNKGAAKCLR